jgi:hypothetical protein
MLDKFNTSTFAHETTSVTGSRVIERTYSPRVALLGNSTFSTEGHSNVDRVVKIADESSNTINKQQQRIQVSEQSLRNNPNAMAWHVGLNLPGLRPAKQF